MRLRNYQKNAFDSIFQAWEDSDSTLVVMPTGTGKTILFAHVAKAIHPKRVLVIAHRQELIWQARDKIRKITGLEVGVEMGENKVTESRSLLSRPSIVVSTIQTQISGGDGAGRYSKFDPSEFGALICDEAHHGTSSGYKKLFNYYRSNSDLKILGVTATPDRADEEALGQVFDTVAYDYEILDAIHDGWLVPVDQQMCFIKGLDFSQARTKLGDLHPSDLTKIMEYEENLHGIATASIEISKGKRGIGFTASVRQAEILAAICDRHEPGKHKVISAKTDKWVRLDTIKAFAAGDVRWIWNCGVLTEGFDDSGVEVVVMARPTKSRSLYAQMAGRATRPHGSIASRLNMAPTSSLRRMMISSSAKPSCLIVDFVGNSGRHKLITSADVLGGNVSDEAIASATEYAKKAGKPVRMDKVLDSEEERIKEAERRRLEQEAKKARLVAKAEYNTKSISPFSLFDKDVPKVRGWDNGKELSEKQKSLLVKAGLNPADFNYVEARKTIDILIARWNAKLCTLKQAKVLRRAGWSAGEVENMTFKEASANIDYISRHGWKKPVEVLKLESESEDNVPF